MNIISYSIFGYGAQDSQSADFRSYLRGLEINLRVAEVLYPGWTINIATDSQTFESEYKNFFRSHQQHNSYTQVIDKAPLCKMMLWRMKPAFSSLTDRFICRDTDSLLSYRERQAVAYWEQGTKVAHAITDSVSHNVSLMGGMIGFQAGYLCDRIGCKTFSEMMSLENNIDYTKKGADQDFLNRHILPRVADSITQHYILGMPQSFMGDCHNTIPEVLEMPDYMRELDGYAFHIGASGYQEAAVLKWLGKHGKNNDMYNEIEKQYSSTFYWQL